ILHSAILAHDADIAVFMFMFYGVIHGTLLCTIVVYRGFHNAIVQFCLEGLFRHGMFVWFTAIERIFAGHIQFSTPYLTNFTLGSDKILVWLIIKDQARLFLV